jgi:hypothetical protein
LRTLTLLVVVGQATMVVLVAALVLTQQSGLEIPPQPAPHKEMMEVIG